MKAPSGKVLIGITLIAVVIAWGFMPCSAACWYGGMRLVFPVVAGSGLGIGIVLILIAFIERDTVH